ncbi:Hypothetical protein, putative [Bodo saltans]|uniref:Uncharacterized protein n=1 Tax=Bodo saltans TaxID=75058 RepID=A0A0S4IN11_BODSA|nr:Hypothetical protein, putative [Bodo saltans]|eukprot:CUE61616.1 Hypothetical protein, putative [Bodo saltans]
MQPFRAQQEYTSGGATSAGGIRKPFAASRLHSTSTTATGKINGITTSGAATTTNAAVVVSVGGVRSRGASLASSCSVMTPISSIGGGGGGNNGLFDVMPLPSVIANAGGQDTTGDVEQLLGSSFRSSGSAAQHRASFPRAASAGAAAAEHVNYWLRDARSSVGISTTNGRPVTSVGHHRQHQATGVVGGPNSRMSTMMVPSSAQQQQRPATRGTTSSPGVGRIGSSPTSIFITQRSRPSSSTSVLNGVLMGGNDPRGVFRSPLSPHPTIGGQPQQLQGSPAGQSITTVFPSGGGGDGAAGASTTSEPHQRRPIAAAAATTSASLNNTTTTVTGSSTTPSPGSPATDGQGKLGGKKKSRQRHQLLAANGDDSVEAHQAAIADLLQEVADVTTTCTRMSTASPNLRGGGGALPLGGGGGPPSPSPGSLDGTTRSGGVLGGGVSAAAGAGSAARNSGKGRGIGGQQFNFQHAYQQEPEALDAALHSLLGSKFAPLAVSLPPTAFLRIEESSQSHHASQSTKLPPNVASAGTAVGATGSPVEGGDGAPSGTAAAAAVPLPRSAHSAQTMQLQIAKTMRDMNTQITVKASLARRDRRNCFGNALSVLRDNKVLHDRLKEHVAKYEEELLIRRGGSIGGFDDASQTSGSPRNSPTRGNHNNDSSFLLSNKRPLSSASSFITENRKSAAHPGEFKAQAKKHRVEQAERGTLARYLKDASVEAFVHNVEQNMSVVRGAERSRDRHWMGLLSFIFSTRAVWSVFEDSLRVKENAEFDLLGSSQRSNLHSQSFCSDPLARGLERNRNAATNQHRRRQLEDHEIENMRPLIADLKSKTCFVARLGFLLYRRKVKAARLVKMLLTQLAKAIHTRTSISRLLKNVKLIQRQVRKWLYIRGQRTEFTCVQLEYFMMERSTYTRVQCQDTKDFEKRKTQQQAQTQGPLHRALTSGAPPASSAAAATAAATSGGTVSRTASTPPPQGPASSSVSAQRIARQGSVSFRGGGAGGDAQKGRSGSITSGSGDFVNNNDNTTSSATPGFFGKRLDDAMRFNVVDDTNNNSNIVVESPRKMSYATAVLVAKPFLSRIAHRNGKRLGPDPVSARLVALETHALYTTAGAKLAPKMRDRLLRFVFFREEIRYRTAKVAWRADWLVAKKNYSWLQELAVVQSKNRVSPAKLELKQFRWPHVPVRRCLLHPNEMRLLVLLGFTLASEEKIRHQQLQQLQQQEYQLQRAARNAAAAAAALSSGDGEGGGGGDNDEDGVGSGMCSERDEEDDEDDATEDEPVITSSRQQQLRTAAAGGGASNKSSIRGGATTKQQQQKSAAATSNGSGGTKGMKSLASTVTGGAAAASSSTSLHHLHKRPAAIPQQEMERMLELLRGFQTLLNLQEVSPEFLA